MKTPSPALCVATLALIVATTGTGIAATKISGQSIRDHSIPASKLALHSVTAKQIKAHAVTKASLAGDVAVDDPTAGPAGPAGPQGPAGTPGLIDPSRLIVAAGGDVNLVANGTATATASCPAGTFVIGGGYTDLGTDQKVYALSSGPATDGTQAWQVRAKNDTAGQNQSTLWHAVAYCVVAA